MSTEIRPPEHRSQVPTLKQLFEELGCDASSSRRLQESAHHWRRNHTCEDGREGRELTDWKCKVTLEMLNRMAQGFLTSSGNGSRFWPSKGSEGSAFRYPEDAKRIASLMQQVFWRQNQYEMRNAKNPDRHHTTTEFRHKTNASSPEKDRTADDPNFVRSLPADLQGSNQIRTLVPGLGGENIYKATNHMAGIGRYGRNTEETASSRLPTDEARDHRVEVPPSNSTPASLTSSFRINSKSDNGDLGKFSHANEDGLPLSTKPWHDGHCSSDDEGSALPYKVRRDRSTRSMPAYALPNDGNSNSRKRISETVAQGSAPRFQANSQSRRIFAPNTAIPTSETSLLQSQASMGSESYDSNSISLQSERVSDRTTPDSSAGSFVAPSESAGARKSHNTLAVQPQLSSQKPFHEEEDGPLREGYSERALCDTNRRIRPAKKVQIRYRIIRTRRPTLIKQNWKTNGLSGKTFEELCSEMAVITRQAQVHRIYFQLLLKEARFDYIVDMDDPDEFDEMRDIFTEEIKRDIEKNQHLKFEILLEPDPRTPYAQEDPSAGNGGHDIAFNI